jgi:hypothetical protein
MNDQERESSDEREGERDLGRAGRERKRIAVSEKVKFLIIAVS